MADSGHNKPLIANESRPADREARENNVKYAHCRTEDDLRSIDDMCEELKKEPAETKHQHKGTWWLTHSIYELDQTKKDMGGGSDGTYLTGQGSGKKVPPPHHG